MFFLFFFTCTHMYTMQHSYITQRLASSPLTPWLAQVDKITDQKTLSTALVQVFVLFPLSVLFFPSPCNVCFVFSCF